MLFENMLINFFGLGLVRMSASAGENRATLGVLENRPTIIQSACIGGGVTKGCIGSCPLSSVGPCSTSGAYLFPCLLLCLFVRRNNLWSIRRYAGCPMRNLHLLWYHTHSKTAHSLDKHMYIRMYIRYPILRLRRAELILLFEAYEAQYMGGGLG